MSSPVPTDHLVQDPLSVIHAHISAIPRESLPPHDSDWGVPPLFASVFTPEVRQAIPSLNRGAHHAAHTRLVRFRCMIQESLEPEYFSPLYEEICLTTGTRTLKSGKYQDSLTIPVGKRIEALPGHAERAVYYAVAVPGEQEWAAHRLDAPYPAPTVSAAGAGAGAGAGTAADAASASAESDRKSRKRTAAATSSGSSSASSAAAAVTNKRAAPASSPMDDNDDNAAGTPSAGASTAGATASDDAAAESATLVIAPPQTGCVLKLYPPHAPVRIGDVVEVVAVAALCPDEAGAAAELDRKVARAEARRARKQEKKEEQKQRGEGKGMDDDEEQEQVGDDEEVGDTDNDDHDDADADEGGSGNWLDDVLWEGTALGAPPSAREPLRLHVLQMRTTVPTEGIIPAPTAVIAADAASTVEGSEFSAALARLRSRPSCSSPSAAAAAAAAAPAAESLTSGFATMRAALLSVLTATLGGDSIAAEALLLHLLSSCSSRVNGVVLGRVNMAISDALAPAPVRGAAAPTPEESQAALARRAASAEAMSHVAEHVKTLMQAVAPRVVSVSAAVDSLNATRWGPVRDAMTGRIGPAPLQIAERTHVVVDETGTGEGVLNNTGCLNYAFLTSLIRESAVNYDVPFAGKLAFPVDAPTLLISAGKPIFDHDLLVPLAPGAAEQGHLPEWVAEELADELPGSQSVAGGSSGESRLWQLREYLQLSRHCGTEFDDESAAFAQKELLYRLQHDRKNSSEARMHMQMTLAKLVAMSFGEARISEEHWKHATGLLDAIMERARPAIASQ